MWPPPFQYSFIDWWRSLAQLRWCHVSWFNWLATKPTVPYVEWCWPKFVIILSLPMQSWPPVATWMVQPDLSSTLACDTPKPWIPGWQFDGFLSASTRPAMMNYINLKYPQSMNHKWGKGYFYVLKTTLLIHICRRTPNGLRNLRNL